MCRHLAYVGDPLPLGHLLSDPAHSLVHQSWAPEHQRSGTVNADGFGVGWYADGDPVPARYRRTGPIWADLTFPDLARVIRTRALLAAVRDATLPGADGEAAAAPFASGRWLFSHNGAVKGWPHSMTPLIPTLPAADLLSLEARTDSAFVWALVLARLRSAEQLAGTVAVGSLDGALPGAVALGSPGDAPAAGAQGDALPPARSPGNASVGTVAAGGRGGSLPAHAPAAPAVPPDDTAPGPVAAGPPGAAPPGTFTAGALGDALAGVVVEIAEAAPSSRLNLLATDGTSIAATAWGDSLWYLLDPGRGAIVASEPYDTDPAWQEVPDATLLTATRTEVLLTPIKDLSAPKELRP